MAVPSITSIKMGRDQCMPEYRYKDWLRLSAAICLLCLIGGRVSTEAQSSSPADILSPIVEAMKKTEAGYGSGRGTVLVEEDGNGRTKSQLIDFRYKGECTRSDFYDVENGQKGALDLVEASNDRNGISYEPKGEDAYIFSTARGTFLRQVGKDMHPATFEYYAASGGLRIYECFERIMETSARKDIAAEVDLNTQGILQVKLDYFPENTSKASAEKQWTTIKVDTQDGFRLVFWGRSEENVDGPGSTQEKTLTLKWKKYGSKWYIESAEQKDDRLVVQDMSGEPIIPEKRHECIKLKVLQYEPDPNIDDREFTLDALGVAVGTKVRDTITRITYGYGGPAVLEDSLLASLDDANGIRRRVDRISAQQDDKSKGDPNSEGGEAGVDLQDVSEALSMGGLASNVSEATGGTSTLKYWACLLVIGTCIVVVLLFRSLHRTRRG